MMTHIRKAETNDMEKILSVLESGRAFLQEQGLSQWQNGTGPSRYVQEDIATRGGHVLLSPQGSICGYATLVAGVDDAYENIRDGAWDNTHDSYIAIHGVAIDAAFRGQGLAGGFIGGLIAIAEDMGYRDIRIDTHPMNTIMQKVILRAGFVYRGMVEFDMPDGKRKAYQISR